MSIRTYQRGRFVMQEIKFPTGNTVTMICGKYRTKAAAAAAVAHINALHTAKN